MKWWASCGTKLGNTNFVVLGLIIGIIAPGFKVNGINYNCLYAVAYLDSRLATGGFMLGCFLS